MVNPEHPSPPQSAAHKKGSNPYLRDLGQRARAARTRRGLSRKALAQASGISERHLANLESGQGNVSVLVLQQVAEVLDCTAAELLGDFTTASAEWLLIRSLLQDCDPQTLQRARLAVASVISDAKPVAGSPGRIALIGLRGAGKSTLGQQLAQRLDLDFIEISRDIEQIAGCSIAEIQNLYGPNAYRRYERQALQQALNADRAAVIATPGGLVTDPANFNLLLGECHCVWLQATPADHMRRVIEQGDFRPMAGNSEAMQDLKDILSARAPFYSQAHSHLDTSLQPLAETLDCLQALVSPVAGQSAAL